MKSKFQVPLQNCDEGFQNLFSHPFHEVQIKKQQGLSDMWVHQTHFEETNPSPPRHRTWTLPAWPRPSPQNTLFSASDQALSFSHQWVMTSWTIASRAIYIQKKKLQTFQTPQGSFGSPDVAESCGDFFGSQPPSCGEPPTTPQLGPSSNKKTLFCITNYIYRKEKKLSWISRFESWLRKSLSRWVDWVYRLSDGVGVELVSPLRTPLGVEEDKCRCA